MYRSIFIALLSVLAAQETCSATQDTSAKSTPGRFKELTSVAEYNRAANSSSPTVIVFNSETCSACDQHKEALAPLTEKYTNVTFYCFDASGDDLKDFRKKHTIKGYPTTQYFKNGKMDRSMLGSFNEDALDGIIYQLVNGKPRPISQQKTTEAA